MAIVAVGLTLSLMWMQGFIGWAIILGQKIGFEVIFRSQFSNLLPILVLALGIDDSLHALHRYKEERRNGASPEEASHISVTRVGRAIMLTSTTTIVAFLANLTSDIAALRSFGIEAGFGVLSAFILTGIWVPLVRHDVDEWMESKGRLEDERDGIIHMVPKEWLANLATTSARRAPLIAILTVLITAMAVPMMLSLKGDFQVEDFIETESDLAAGIYLVNDRFSDEGEPGFILVEGDMADPKVIAAFGELRQNVNSREPGEPDQISRLPTGEVELIAIDSVLILAKAAMAWDIQPFEQAGWESNSEDGGMGCDKDILGLPSLGDRDCLLFLYGYMLTRGIPESGGYPSMPPSIAAEYIQVADEIDYDSPWLTISGEPPSYIRAAIRFGISSPEQFALVEPALKQLQGDMAPLQELARDPLRERGDIDLADSEYPITWAIPSGEPVVRFVAADSMQDEMQGTLLLGVAFCTLTLWWGFREETSARHRWRDNIQSKSISAQNRCGCDTDGSCCLPVPRTNIRSYDGHTIDYPLATLGNCSFLHCHSHYRPDSGCHNLAVCHGIIGRLWAEHGHRCNRCYVSGSGHRLRYPFHREISRRARGRIYSRCLDSCGWWSIRAGSFRVCHLGHGWIHGHQPV